MSEENKNNFLTTIHLENYSPFQNGEIQLGGEGKIQSLIKFYLQKKGSKNLKENAERFKINCIVGENGTGKSRLLEKILNEEKSKYCILDDFFILSRNFLEKDKWYSNVNSPIFKDNLPSGQNYGFNGFLSGLFVFDCLNKKVNDFSFFSAFHPEVQEYSLEFSDTKKLDVFPFRKNFIESENASAVFWTQKQTEELRNALSVLHKKVPKGGIGDLLQYAIEYASQRKYNKTSSIEIDNLHGGQKTKDNYWNDEAKKSYWNDEIAKNFCQNVITEIKSISELSLKDQILILTFLFEKVFWNIDLVYHSSKSKNSQQIAFSSFSSGEKAVALRLWNMYREIVKLRSENKSENKKDFLILIDEPDLHLHLDRQRQYIQKLIDVFSTLPTDIQLHFIIATHSPFLISDLPTECIIALEKNKEGKTERKSLEGRSTFWANFVDLIRNWFFFKEQMLMWSFAETIIKEIAEKEREEILDRESQKTDKEQKSESLEDIKKMIWDDFLRDNLLYFK